MLPGAQLFLIIIIDKDSVLSHRGHHILRCVYSFNRSKQVFKIYLHIQHWLKGGRRDLAQRYAELDLQ